MYSGHRIRFGTELFGFYLCVLLWHSRLQGQRYTGAIVYCVPRSREAYERYELGVEGRRTQLEEIGFILQLISNDNREYHVSAGSGVYSSHESPQTRSHLGHVRVYRPPKHSETSMPVCHVAVLLKTTSCSHELEANADVEQSSSCLVIFLPLFLLAWRQHRLFSAA